MHLMKSAMAALGLAAVMASSGAGFAQTKVKSVEEMIAEIEARSGRYAKLEPFLASSDPSVRRAAFQTAASSGDPLLRARVLSDALNSGDTALRIAALRELMFSRPNFVVDLQPEEGDEQGAAWAAKRGGLFTLKINARFPELNCLSLYSSSECDPGRAIGVEGLAVTMVSTFGAEVRGHFLLNDEAELVDSLSDNSLEKAIPAKIVLF